MWPLALLLLGADPCALPPPGPADPAAAAVYRGVGDEERAQGQLASAAVAYRQALALGLTDPNLTQDYLAACQGKGPDALLDDGLAALRAGDRPTALARFLQVQRLRPDPTAALLEGICRYEVGDDAGARPALERAAKDPSVKTSAELFLGLVALREGAEGEAAARFEQAQADAALSARGLELSRIARQQGPLVLSATLEGALDSNLDLSPDGSPQGGDAGMDLSAVARVQPWGTNGPFLRGGAVLSRQRTLTELNLLGVDGAAGVQFARGADFFLAEYEYSRRALGGLDYLATHRLHAFAQKAFGRALFDASYGAEHRGYLQPSGDGYSGWWQRGALEAGFRARALALLAGYALARDGAALDSLASWEQGPLLEARLRPDAAWRLSADLSASFRRFDALDPDFEVRRADTRWSAGATAELELGLRWTALLALSAERNVSNVPSFTYSAFSATVGLQFTLGVTP